MKMSKMHANEFDISLSLVQKLVRRQFPEWAHLPLKSVSSAGTDNALYRLGDDLVVRLPRIDWAVSGAEVEYTWLPKLAPFLPTPVPIPLGRGIPTEDYPWPWAIYHWIEGQNPLVGHIPNLDLLIDDLVAFIQALHKVDLPNGPLSSRGVPLENKDDKTRKALKELEGVIDVQAVTSLWEVALKSPKWIKPPVWIHSDLSPGNLLMRNDRLCAVIDFGMLGIGDPACDLIIAWNLLPAHKRDLFFRKMGVDEAFVARGRGWALSIALIALPYYKDTNPVLAANARHVIKEILQEGF